jgi:hypothetical protein
VADFRTQLKPLDSTESQLRSFHQVYDGIPWADVSDALHGAKIDRPVVPNYADFVDRTVTGQEDLVVAFQELFTAPTSRHVFSFALAAFIDIIVFLLAFASGPHFFGSKEQRWLSSAAALDGLDEQIFVRGFLRKLTATARGVARVDSNDLSAGEQQLCLLLVAKKLAMMQEEEGRRFYLLDHAIQEQLLESLSVPGLPLHASAKAGAS